MTDTTLPNPAAERLAISPPCRFGTHAPQFNEDCGLPLAPVNGRQGTGSIALFDTHPRSAESLLRQHYPALRVVIRDNDPACYDLLVNATAGAIALLRNRKFADSPLEGRVTSELVSEFPNSLLTGKERIKSFCVACRRKNSVGLTRGIGAAGYGIFSWLAGWRVCG